MKHNTVIFVKKTWFQLYDKSLNDICLSSNFDELIPKMNPSDRKLIIKRLVKLEDWFKVNQIIHNSHPKEYLHDFVPNANKNMIYDMPRFEEIQYSSSYTPDSRKYDND
jgi:hypothetical protein